MVVTGGTCQAQRPGAEDVQIHQEVLDVLRVVGRSCGVVEGCVRSGGAVGLSRH